MLEHHSELSTTKALLIRHSPPQAPILAAGTHFGPAFVESR
jgi:hypothetical protein